MGHICTKCSAEILPQQPIMGDDCRKARDRIYKARQIYLKDIQTKDTTGLYVGT